MYTVWHAYLMDQKSYLMSTVTAAVSHPTMCTLHALFRVRQAQKKKKKHIRLTKKKPDEKKLVLKKLREFIEEEAQAKGDQVASKPPV